MIPGCSHLLGSVVARTMGDLGDVPAVRLAVPPGGLPPRTAVNGKPLNRRQRPSLLRGCGLAQGHDSSSREATSGSPVFQLLDRGKHIPTTLSAP